MAEPVFKNVQFNPTSQTSNAAFKAGDLINKAFQQIAGTVDDRAEVDRENVAAVTEGNTQRMISEIQNQQDLETFDTDAQKLVSRLSQEATDQGTGFNLAAINEAVAKQKATLQDTRRFDQEYSLGERDVEAKETANEIAKLKAKATPRQIELEQSLLEAQTNTKKAQNKLATVQLQEQSRVYKVASQRRKHINEFQGIQTEWIDALDAQQQGKTLTPEQQELVNTSATDLVRQFTLDNRIDEETAQGIAAYHQGMVGLNVQTPEQIANAKAKLTEVEFENKKKLAQMKITSNEKIANMKLTQLGKGKSYTNNGTGLNAAINDVMDSLPEDFKTDDDADRIQEYARNVFFNWKELGFAEQPSVKDIGIALELGVNLEYSDHLWSEDVIQESDFHSILLDAERGNVDVESMIAKINRERLEAKQAAEKALQEQAKAAGTP